MRFNRIVAATVVAGLVAAWGGQTVSAATSHATAHKSITNIIVGFTGVNPNLWSLAIMGYDPGYCDQYGVNIQDETLSTAAITPAVDNGDVQFTSAAGNILTAMAEGTVTNEKVIASGGYTPLGSLGIWATPQITSLAQLATATYGAPTATSTTHLGAEALLQSKGINNETFTYLNNSTAMWAAMSNSTIGAAWSNGPIPAPNQSAGDHLVLPLSKAPALKFLATIWLVGNAPWMNAHPAATKGFLECLEAVTKAGRSSNPTVLARLQAVESEFLGTLTEAQQTWPEYPISAAVQLMTPALDTQLQNSMNLQLASYISPKAIAAMTSTKWMKGVPNLPPINVAGTSPKFAIYSGR